MGIFSKLNVFKKKEKVADVNAELEKIKPLRPMEVGNENVNARMELVATKIESLGIKYDTLNERLDRIEKMLNAIYELAKQ
jgi:hypothetical protein